MAKLSLRDVDVRGKRVLTRVDFNVPIKENGDNIEITDDTRIREALPTINYLREQKAKIIDRRQRFADSRVVGNFNVVAILFDRHIEIDASQNALPANVDISKRKFRHAYSCSCS